MLRRIAVLIVVLFSMITGWSVGLLHAQDLDLDVPRERLAQTGMKFLNLSVDPRAAALGDAMTGVEGTSSSLFYNPAGMAWSENTAHFSLGQVEWIAGIRHHMGSLSFRPANGRFGTFGLSVQAVDYGEILSTIRADNQQGFLDVESVQPTAFVAGLGYARAVTDRFAVGAQVKFARQSLGASYGSMADFEAGASRVDHEEGTLAADFGMLYRTGFRSLNFGASVRNFSRELTYAQDSFELPLTFRMGFSMDLMDFVTLENDNHTALMAIDVERPRDYAEQIRLGLEYQFMSILTLRAGYVTPTDQQGINLGAGLNYGIGAINAAVNYSYTDFGVFGGVNRFGIGLGF